MSGSVNGAGLWTVKGPAGDEPTLESSMLPVLNTPLGRALQRGIPGYMKHARPLIAQILELPLSMMPYAEDEEEEEGMMSPTKGEQAEEEGEELSEETMSPAAKVKGGLVMDASMLPSRSDLFARRPSPVVVDDALSVAAPGKGVMFSSEESEKSITLPGHRKSVEINGGVDSPATPASTSRETLNGGRQRVHPFTSQGRWKQAASRALGRSSSTNSPWISHPWQQQQPSTGEGEPPGVPLKLGGSLTETKPPGQRLKSLISSSSWGRRLGMTSSEVRRLG